MIYAPILIPTLCRYDHFKACFESLEKCTGADKTVIYVALDFPVEQTHKKGNSMIESYLNYKRSCCGFKELIVFKRKYNYGLGKNGNASQLLLEIFKMHDRVIFSEDDNIFSPCFLEFINKGLELFKDDKNVLAINGYSHAYPIKYNTNTFYRQNVDFSAWGYGIWKDRFNILFNLDNQFFKDSISLKNIVKVHRNGNNRLLSYLIYIFSNKNIPMEDNTFSVFASLTDMDVVMPTISLVRNMGWDGSGEHFNNEKLSKFYSNQDISKEMYFEYRGNGYEFYRQNRSIYALNSRAYISYWALLKELINSLIRHISKRLM